MERASAETPGRPADTASHRSETSRRGARTAAAFAAVVGLALIVGAAWDGARVSPRERALTDVERIAAADAVHAYLTMSSHLRSSGGDPRFAERVPADDQVTGELLREIEFLRHVSRVEEPRLVRAEVRDVRAEAEGIANVLTKEYWITRVTARTPFQPETRSDVVLARYTVRRESGGWRVASWQIDMNEAGSVAPAGPAER